MLRRTSGVAVLLTASFLFTTAPAAMPTVAAATPTPHNTVMIMVDDLPWFMMDFLPMTKSLLGDGINFTSNIISTSTCCPSRSTTLSGLLPNHTGVLNNEAPFGGATLFDHTKTFVNTLHQAGYQTGLFGKYLNEIGAMQPYPYRAPGWDDFQAMKFTGLPTNGYYNYYLFENGVAKYYKTTAAEYSTNLLLNRTLAFINRNGSSKPFFAFYAPFAPHKPAVPGPGDEHVYDGLVVPHLPNFNEADVSDKPTWIRNKAALTATKQAELDQLYRDMAETLLSVDRAVAQIVQKLKDLNIFDNTLIMFVSDNGLSLGSHRWDLKECAYEECIRTPLIIHKPGSTVTGQQDDVVLNSDYAPTILDWMGVAPQWQMDGSSLLPYFSQADAPPIRQQGLIQVLARNFNENANFIGLRSADYTYARYRNGNEELYDLHADPYELTNLILNPNYASVLGAMRATLDSMKDPTDLRTSGSITATTVAPGASVTVDLTITNPSNVLASNVYVKYVVPTKFTQASCQGSDAAACYVVGTGREVRFMSVPAGRSVTAKVTFTAKTTATAGSQTFSFFAEPFNTVDPNGVDNTRAFTVLVQP
jgi:arylsulfatase A-like enzyme